MNMTCLLSFGMLAWANVALGYLVGPAESLQKLDEQSDVIFKATAVSSVMVKDTVLEAITAFEAWETTFKLVSMVKGTHTGVTLKFRHYDYSPNKTGWEYQPQYYQFKAGETYMVFADRTETSSVYRQIWLQHKGKDDQGAIRCASDKPASAGTIKEVLWNELQALLASSRATDIQYGIQQLDDMSGKGGVEKYDATYDFDRGEVISAMVSFMSHSDENVSRAANGVIGSANPYLRDEVAEFWLATVGSAEVPGISKMDAQMKNPGGELLWKELTAIADSQASPHARAAAIRSLGLVRRVELKPSIDRWLVDIAAPVRAAATLLLADFPGNHTQQLLRTQSADPVPLVRICTANAIGFMQLVELADTLDSLLHDEMDIVRRAASLSLLSFSPKHVSIERVMLKHMTDEEFYPLFLNGLAAAKPADYLEPLSKAVAEQPRPTNWTGGQIPAYTAWNILYKHLAAQPAEAFRAGKFDREFKALEKGYSTGSSEQCRIYALYLARGLTERAEKYRTAATKAVKYDLRASFDQVVNNPSAFIY